MKRASIVAAPFASLLCAPGAAEPPQVQGLPPTPPPIYDPQPGPFIVRLNDQGKVGDDQLGVITNAVKAWSGPTLQALVICFHSPRQPIGWRSAFDALKLVSAELKAHGAAIVVMPNGTLCDTSAPEPSWSGDYVKIMGVVRA